MGNSGEIQKVKYDAREINYYFKHNIGLCFNDEYLPQFQSVLDQSLNPELIIRKSFLYLANKHRKNG